MTVERETSNVGVVVHLDEAAPEKQNSVLRNISNLLNELGEKTEIELVVHGPGLSAALATAPHAAQLRELLNRGIAVAACSNSMREKNTSIEDLTEGVHVVPAGIAEIVRRQRQGWSNFHAIGQPFG